MAKKKDTNERTISQQEVWDEHLSDVNVPAHWAYALGVMAGGFVLMVAFMALLGGGG